MDYQSCISCEASGCHGCMFHVIFGCILLCSINMSCIQKIDRKAVGSRCEFLYEISTSNCHFHGNCYQFIHCCFQFIGSTFYLIFTSTIVNDIFCSLNHSCKACLFPAVFRIIFLFQCLCFCKLL